jgi:NAD(P)H-dependent flavin oxidoreductase YrpB (nitropropane dioxygenase family)
VVSDAHANGIKVVALVGNVKNALRMSNMGVDVVVAQGHEAGGHTGRIGTLALVPQIVDAVSPKPVLAAGGIGDGRGLAAALALGAQGVWVGTRFICTPECFSEWLENPDLYMGLMPDEKEDAELYQQHILEASEEDTTVTRVYTGKTARVLKNQMIKDWESARIPTLPMPLQSIAIEGLLVAMRKIKHPAAVFSAAGQICGMIKDVRSVKELMEEMVEKAVHILKNHSGATIS